MDFDKGELTSVKTQHFDRVWSGVAQIAEELIAGGETSLSRVLRLTEAKWRKVDTAPSMGAVYGAVVTLPRAALIGGRQHFHSRALIGACTPETDLVVELGSGWGLNLLDLYLAGGPRSARYRGFELSTSGRACASKLAALEPELDFDAHPFNYFEPDYSAVAPTNGHALVFTSHSIEQAPLLSPSVVTELFALGANVTGVHFEPVGWQIREAKGLPPASVGATRENSERVNYNRNFWELLSRLEKDGAIRIDKVEPDILGHKTKNASSLIVWQKT